MPEVITAGRIHVDGIFSFYPGSIGIFPFLLFKCDIFLFFFSLVGLLLWELQAMVKHVSVVAKGICYSIVLIYFICRNPNPYLFVYCSILFLQEIYLDILWFWQISLLNFIINKQPFDETFQKNSFFLNKLHTKSFTSKLIFNWGLVFLIGDSWSNNQLFGIGFNSLKFLVILPSLNFYR
jgi:hypothetical protein